MTPILWVIVGMGAVTYLPRMMPLVILKTEHIPLFLQNILKNVPFAVLGALIFPGVFLIHSGSIYHINPSDVLFGFIGAVVAFIASYLGLNIVFVVLSSIAALAIYSLLPL